MNSIRNYVCNLIDTIELFNYEINATDFTSKKSANSTEKVRSYSSLYVKDTDSSTYVKKIIFCLM